MFYDILPIVIDVWREHGYQSNADQVRDFIFVSWALVQGVPLPNRGDFETWKNQQLAAHANLRPLVEEIANIHNE